MSFASGLAVAHGEQDFYRLQRAKFTGGIPTVELSNQKQLCRSARHSNQILAKRARNNLSRVNFDFSVDFFLIYEPLIRGKIAYGLRKANYEVVREH